VQLTEVVYSHPTVMVMGALVTSVGMNIDIVHIMDKGQGKGVGSM
jgi:hypothetical protein